MAIPNRSGDRPLDIAIKNDAIDAVFFEQLLVLYDITNVLNIRESYRILHAQKKLEESKNLGPSDLREISDVASDKLNILFAWLEEYNRRDHRERCLRQNSPTIASNLPLVPLAEHSLV